LIGTIKKAQYPKALMGISDENPFAKKAKAVVLEVAKHALYDLLNVYAIRFFKSPLN